MKDSNKPLVDQERAVELNLVRATEAAALSTFQWIGKGEKNAADAAACDAIRGMFDEISVCGKVMIGEGIKDNAPGIFLGEKLGTWEPDSLKLDIAIDPIDGTTNVSKGLPNSISVLAAASPDHGQKNALVHLPSFYCQKLAYGPAVVAAVEAGQIDPLALDAPIETNLRLIGKALNKRVQDLTVVLLDRPRHEELVRRIRQAGASIRMIGDGDVAGAIAPALPDGDVDLYCGIGGSAEAVLAAAALRCLGGDIQVRMWPRDDAERAALTRAGHGTILKRAYAARELARGDSILFCATGITDSPLLRGLKMTGVRAITHSIVMRARHRTVRFIKSYHDLSTKKIRLRSDRKEHKL